MWVGERPVYFNFEAIVNDIEFPGETKSRSLTRSLVDYKFGRIPNWIIKTGLLSNLSGNAVKIFNVLLIFVHNTSHCGKLSNAILANYSGVCQKNIAQYIKELSEARLLETLKNGWVRNYRLNLAEPRDTTDLCLKERRKRKIPENRVCKIPENRVCLTSDTG
jgi:hypothetical protein